MAECSDNSHSYTESNIRCLKCVFVVMEIFPKIMQRLMHTSPIPAPATYALIQKDKILKKKLTTNDHTALQTLQQGGYSKLDLTLIFKIITYFTNMFISPPTRGWNSNPVPCEIEIGDDAQRLRLKRNHFLHKVEAKVNEEDYEEFFSEVSSICERMDRVLNCSEEESFKSKVETYKIQPLTNPAEIQRIYVDEKMLTEFFVEQVGRTEFKVYKAKSLKDFIQQLGENHMQQQETLEPITLIFPEINDSESNQIMNELKEEINQGLVNIKVVGFRKGSLLVDIMVPTAILLNDDPLQQELTQFLRRLSTINVREEVLNTIPMVTMVMSECEAYHDEDQFENMSGDDTMYSPGSLQIDLQVKRFVLQSEEMLQTQLVTLFDTIASKSNGNQIFLSDKPIVSVVEPGIKGVSQIGFSDQDQMDETESTPSASPGKCESTKGAQVKSEKYQAQVHKQIAIHLQMQQQFTLESGHGSNCDCFCTLPSGLMVFIHMSSSLIVIKPDGRIKSSITFDFISQYCISSINENCVAVPHLESAALSIIDVNTEQLVKTFRTKGYLYGIAFNNEYILYCARFIGIMRLDIESDTCNIVYRDSSVGSKIAALNDRICYNHYTINTIITVLDSKYNVLFKYSDENMLAHVKDITMDPKGYIYAIGYDPNSLVVIYPDGKTCHKLLSKDDGQRKLRFVHYDPSSEHLIVLYGGGTVCKFQYKRSE